MKLKKINKAIKTLRKFCKAQGENCRGCPLDSNLGCKLKSGLPEDWRYKIDGDTTY